MHLRTARRFEQRVRRLLDAIVDECDAAAGLQDQAGLERLTQIAAGLLLGFAVHQRQDRQLALVADARSDPSTRSASRPTSPVSRCSMKSMTFSVYPRASMRAMSQRQVRLLLVEPQQPFLMQQAQELEHEERIARGLGVHDGRQRPSALAIGAHRVGEQREHFLHAERRERQLARPACAILRMRSSIWRERMRRIDLVVAVGADQQQVMGVGSLMISSQQLAGWPASAHCKSSRNSTSGCCRRVKTPRKSRNTRLKAQLGVEQRHLDQRLAAPRASSRAVG